MHRFRRLAAMAAGAGLLALGGVTAVAVSASAATIGSCSAAGAYATCVASGTFNHPITITVTVTSSPDQSVSVAWDAVCTQGTGAGSKSGSFTANTPVTRAISHPYSQPDQCIVSADAQLQDGGNSVHVAIGSSSTPPPPPRRASDQGLRRQVRPRSGEQFGQGNEHRAMELRQRRGPELGVHRRPSGAQRQMCER
jgi:hypothetical protein